MSQLSLLSSVVAFLSWSALPVSADLPVHCLRHQIEGEWEFTLSRPSPERSSCGHERPDNERREPSLYQLDDGPTTSMKVSLSMPNRAQTETDVAGTFTMIYDEGWEVAVDGKVFFAFSRFDLDSTGRNETHCDETLTGWYHDANGGNYGCYFGRKQSSPSRSSVPASTQQFAPDLDFNSRANAWATALSSSSDAHQQEDPILSAEFHRGVVDRLNEDHSDDREQSPSESRNIGLDDLSNVFGEYSHATGFFPRESSTGDHEEDHSSGAALLQETTEERGASAKMTSSSSTSGKSSSSKRRWKAKVYQSMVGKTRAELNRLAGIKRRLPLSAAHRNQHRLRSRRDHQRSHASSSFLQTSTAASRVGKTKTKVQLPRSVDWSEQGVLDEVVNQGDCGSCFTVATTRMLSARNRVKHSDNSLEPFSISFPLHCSEYNQGCNGGYAFLQSKWSEDVGLIPAKCFPYNAGASCTDDISLECVKSAGRSFRAVNHRYIGGYYGGSDEQDIMEELALNGPLVVSFEPKDDFMYYQSGVYQSSSERIHQEWEKVDHAVLLVGYGEDEAGQKFWKVQNSWGDEWGEKGFFRISRGDNDSGIESISVAADIEEVDGSMVESFLEKRKEIV
ncbi:unnamed protein product [Amoebophrya sp. A25]|nr:unnamed protein product [Amoebophrya sp. A25]|eukprot:GSA25T00006801001.1